jgi:hypothetical protein
LNQLELELELELELDKRKNSEKGRKWKEKEHLKFEKYKLAKALNIVLGLDLDGVADIYSLSRE